MLVIVALIPLLVAIFLLLVFQWNIRDTGWTVLGVTVALASLVPAFHRTSWQVALSLGEGSATTLTIGVILLPALFFFQMQQETGAIDILMRGLAKFVPDRDLQTLLLVLGVGPCIEGVCGSGSGALAIIPLLVRVHDNKLKAVQLSLLSQIIAAWGSLGVGMTFAADLARLPVESLSVHTALLLFPSTIGFSILALQFSGGWKALERYWCAALLSGSLLIFVTCLCSQFFITEVAGVLASPCVIALVLVWSLLRSTEDSSPLRGQVITTEITQLMSASLPYFLLTTGIFVTRLFPHANAWLQTHGVLVPPAITLHLPGLESPGLWLLLAALVHIPLFPSQGVHLIRMHEKIWRRFLPAVIATVSFLSTVALMQDSGMIDTLGGAAAMLGENYMWSASLLGAVGGWLTSTIRGGNALTVPMQMDVSLHIGLPLPWLIAAQNASAAMGSAVSPSQIILLATSVGLFGKEAFVLRKLGPVILWSLMLTTLLLVWFTSSSWFETMIVPLLLLVVVNAPILSITRHKGESAERSDGSPIQVFLTEAKTHTVPFSSRVGNLAVRILAYGGLLLVNLLYASFSLVSMEPLNRVDPVLFLCFQMLLLVPIALVLLVRARRRLPRALLYRGLLLGGFLSTGLLLFSLSLKTTGITETMAFSCINGVIATVIAWRVFGERISLLTWGACLLALVGAALVWSTSPEKWQGNFSAFVGGILLTGYTFQVERLLIEVQKDRWMIQPVLGVQFLTTALTTLVIALCFGQWQTVYHLVPSDLAALLYLSLATILVPNLIMLAAQRYLSAVTVAFFNIIEPLAGVGCAFVFAGERLPILAYIGGGIVLASIVLQVVAGTVKQDQAAAPIGLTAPIQT
jgi:lactate permease